MAYRFRPEIPNVVVIFGVALIVLAGSLRAEQPVWQSGFENGFPGGEWFDFDNGSYSAIGIMPTDRTSAWTIVGRQSGEPVFAGNHAYKGWITGPAGDSHRAYPVVHVDIPTPLVNTFRVYLDTDYERMSPLDWIHLGTWGNRDSTADTGRWALHTLGVRNRKLEFAHTSPFHGEPVDHDALPEFPLRRWVRLTVYLLYQGSTGFVQVWQDGAPMLRAAVSNLVSHPGTRLRTAHWGMYASGGIVRAVQYNDEIRICALEAPLEDRVREPLCPTESGAQGSARP